MAKRSLPSLDFAALQNQIQGQFRGLNPNDPASWPVVPRIAVCLALMAAIVVALWFVWLSGSDEELNAERAKEVQVREEFQKKLVQAVNLEALRKQREQVQQYVTKLAKPLPSRAAVDALLSALNQAGLGYNLQFELFKPGQVVVKEYYAELPITLRVTGRYHDVGAFASDIANLSRIVTLSNLAVVPTARDGYLTMEGIAKTYRYLDGDEVIAQRKATGAKK